MTDDPIYVRLFNLLGAVRDISPFDVMTAEEDELLRSLLVRWHVNQTVSISDAMDAMSGVSTATAYRRVIKLRDKGLIHLRVDEDDKRVKLVEPTPTALQYAGHVHAALERLFGTRGGG